MYVLVWYKATVSLHRLVKSSMTGSLILTCALASLPFLSITVKFLYLISRWADRTERSWPCRLTSASICWTSASTSSTSKADWLGANLFSFSLLSIWWNCVILYSWDPNAYLEGKWLLEYKFLMVAPSAVNRFGVFNATTRSSWWNLSAITVFAKWFYFFFRRFFHRFIHGKFHAQIHGKVKFFGRCEMEFFPSGV